MLTAVRHKELLAIAAGSNARIFATRLCRLVRAQAGNRGH